MPIQIPVVANHYNKHYHDLKQIMIFHQRKRESERQTERVGGGGGGGERSRDRDRKIL